MNTIENSLIATRQAELDGAMPGSVALADAQAEQARVRQQESDAEADKQWRAANSPEPNYNYRAAHTTGVDLTKGELPNEFYEPGTQNVAGFDMPTGKKFKSVVFKDYEENAFYGVSQLSKSKKRIGGERPPDDSLGMTAIAASMQGSGYTYEDFANAFPDWTDNHKKLSWRAGTDALRQKQLVDQYGHSFLVGLYTAQPTSLDFDVRMADKQFQKLGRTLYRHYWGKEFNDTDTEAARWLAGHLRDIDFNPLVWPMVMLKAKNAGADVHQAYAQALEAWELTNMEKSFLPQLGNFGRLLFDPFNYVGMGVGKLTVMTAGRMAAKDFFKRMAVGAAVGAPEGAALATVKADVQGRSPTGTELAVGAASGAAGAGFGNAAAPEVLAATVKAGKAVARGIKAFARPDMPALPPNNVAPQGSGIYGEISLPNRAGDQPVRTTPEAPEPAGITREEAESLAVPREEPALEQEPFRPEGPPLTPEEIAAHAQRVREYDEAVAAQQAQDAPGLAAGEAAAAALPPAPRPPLPLDPASRVFVDPATGYYSTSQKAVAEFGKDEAPASEWLAVMDKAPNRRLDEIAWLDMEKLFKKYKGQPVPKQAVLDHIDKNMIKTQRYPLVPQRRDTVPFDDYLLTNSAEYKQLNGELERLEQGLEAAQRAHIDVVAYPGSTQAEINAARGARDEAHKAIMVHKNHMNNVRAEEYKAWEMKGERPPGVHGIEEMLTDHDSGVAAETRQSLAWIYQLLESEATHQALKSRARSPMRIAALDAAIAGDQRLIKDAWRRFEDFAREGGAFVSPSDLQRVEGMMKFGDPEVRGASLLGHDQPGAKFTINGVDPLGHQINLYRHPEGLKIGGSEAHPGGSATGVTGWAITSERAFENGETIRFVDEGQNDFVKMRRSAEQAFKKAKAQSSEGQPVSAAIQAAETYDDYVWLNYREAKLYAAKTPAQQSKARALPMWADTTPQQRMDMMRDPIWNEGSISSEADLIEILPKQLFYPTALSNVFKSELYNAALDGKEWFGWTTNETLWARNPYLAPTTLSSGPKLVHLAGPGSERIGISNRDELGRIRDRSRTFTFDEAITLGDKIGGEQGAVLRKFAASAKEFSRMQHEMFAPPHPGEVPLDLSETIVVGEGKVKIYDTQVKQDMDKFLKTLGIPDAVVEKREMPIAPGSPVKATGWFVKITPELRARLAKGVPLGAAAGAAVIAGQEEEAMQ